MWRRQVGIAVGPLCAFLTVRARSGGILLRMLTVVTKAVLFQRGRNISIPADGWKSELLYSGFRNGGLWTDKKLTYFMMF